MRLVLIRHGQSGNNVIWEQTGSSVGRHPDTPLTDRGHDQARRLAAAIADGALPWRIDAIYTSLMTRAVQTAAPIADALDLPLHPLDIFETSGPFEEDAESGDRSPYPGASRSELLALSERLQLADDVDEQGWWRGEVELLDAVLDRAKAAIAAVRERHPADATLALVTHGHFTQYLLMAFLRIERIGGWITIDNTAVTLLEEDPRWPDSPNAVRINSTPHLSDAERTT
ncbi:MAG: histidine phosphatase family protein [Tetrasphaera jenkinsii]|jgi:2,3-bisphosphoglycerate-dependent phosphoglycerate mutase|nr:histidine phosphatase family protein [Tetrasphaera jenkinsii]